MYKVSNSAGYGQWSDNENYKPFDYQIQNSTAFNDISEGKYNLYDVLYDV
jgi:hypothetical protein